MGLRLLSKIALLFALAAPCAHGQLQFVIAAAGMVATPTFSPGAGTYTSTQTVTISTATALAVLCYTTDGSTPTESANLCSGGTTATYSTPITVSASQTVKALGTLATYTDSSVGSATYTISLLPTATYDWLPNSGCSTSVACMTDAIASNNASQTISGDLPTYSATGGPNSTKSLSFNGTSDFLTFATGVPYPTAGHSYTFYTVWKTPSTTTIQPILDIALGSGSLGYGSRSTTYMGLTDAGVAQIAADNVAMSNNTWYAKIVVYTYTSSSSATYAFFTCSSGTSNAGASGSAVNETFTRNTTRIGASATSYGNISLAEVGYYNGTWSGAQNTAFCAYANARYGL